MLFSGELTSIGVLSPGTDARPPIQTVPKSTARLGLPGDNENIVSLNADHSGVCKFGMAREDGDKLFKVLRNIQDLHDKALEKCMSIHIKPASSTRFGQ